MSKERNWLIHPSYVILILIIAAMSALFLGFTGAYLYSRVQSGIEPIELPSLFYCNTLILLASSLTLIWTKQQYLEDQTNNYKFGIAITTLLSLFFLFMQIKAYGQLIDAEVFLDQDNMASYLYIISGLHFAHVILGLPFLIYFLIEAIHKMVTPVSVLIYFSDPSKKRQLNLLTLYWHFLDALWIYLVLFFFINSLI